MRNKIIYEIALQSKECIDKEVHIRKNIIPRNHIVFTDYDVTGELKKLESLLLKLVSMLNSINPQLAMLLTGHIDSFDNDRIIHISAIEGIVDSIINMTRPQAHSHKIFISHSSKDLPIVERFVDDILQLGIGLDCNDIFCTSIEDMAIHNGEDIRQHIHANIKDAEYSIILFSQSYKKSEICLNEMGAVWAYDTNVRYYILPDMNFSEIGWLTNPKQAESIISRTALDALQKELIEYFRLPDKGLGWSRNRDKFVRSIEQISVKQ